VVRPRADNHPVTAGCGGQTTDPWSTTAGSGIQHHQATVVLELVIGGAAAGVEPFKIHGTELTLGEAAGLAGVEPGGV